MKIETKNGNKYFIAEERLCWTKDRKRIVVDTDPEADVLYATPGTYILDQMAYDYGMAPRSKSVAKKPNKAVKKNSDK